MDAREYFRLDAGEAEEILATVRSATARWADVAAKVGLPQREIDAMAPAFEATLD